MEAESSEASGLGLTLSRSALEIQLKKLQIGSVKSNGDVLQQYANALHAMLISPSASGRFVGMRICDVELMLMLMMLMLMFRMGFDGVGVCCGFTTE